MRAPAVCLLVVLAGLGPLAGCASVDPKAPPAGPPSPAAPPPDAPPDAPLAPTALAVHALSASVEPRWVRAGEAMEARADARGVVDWFVASRNPLREAPPALADRVQPGSAVSFDVGAAGRHTFTVGGAIVTVSVVPGLAPETLRAVASRESDAWRVAPHALRGGVGSRLVVEDRAGEDALVERREVDAFAATGASVSFAMPDGLEFGDYDVVAVALDERSVGESATRIVYDRRKPDVAWEAGPFAGSFEAAPGSEPARHAWEAEWDARNVTVAFSAESALPAPFAARASLVDASGAEVAGGPPPGFEVAALPKGSYAFVVEAAEGLLVDYALTARGEWVLVPPSSFFTAS